MKLHTNVVINTSGTQQNEHHFVHAPSQWETTLHCNVVSHCLCAYTKWSLILRRIFSRHMLPVKYIFKNNIPIFWFTFPCTPGVPLILNRRWFGWWPGAVQVTSYYLNQWHIYASPDVSELTDDAWANMMTSSNGNIFRVTGHLCGEFTGPRWISHTKASDTELWCFLWSASE